VREKCISKGFWRFFCCWIPSKRSVLVRKNALAPCQMVLPQRQTTRSDVSFQTKQCKCLAVVELTLHTYTQLCFFKVVCCPPSRLRQSRVMSIAVLLLNGFGSNRDEDPTLREVRWGPLGLQALVSMCIAHHSCVRGVRGTMIGLGARRARNFKFIGWDIYMHTCSHTCIYVHVYVTRVTSKYAYKHAHI